MKRQSLALLYYLFMAAMGAIGGALLGWSAPSTPAGRLLIVSFAIGILVALASHILLWRRQPFNLARTLTPILFFGWWGTVAEGFRYWLSKQ